MKKENPFYNLNNNNYEHINPFVNSYNQISIPDNNINNNQQHQQFPQIPQQMPQIQQPMQQIYQPMQQIQQQMPQIQQPMQQIYQQMQQIYQPMQQIQQPTQQIPQQMQQIPQQMQQIPQLMQQIPQQMQQIPQQNTENNNNKRPNKYLLINKIRDPIIIDFHAHPLHCCFTIERGAFSEFWTCKNCGNNYSFDIPSFYCTYCDYDLCQNCLMGLPLGKIKFADEKCNFKVYVNKNHPNYRPNFHQHPLALVKLEEYFYNDKNIIRCKRVPGFDNNGKKIGNEEIQLNKHSFYLCSLCNYYICKDCFQNCNQNFVQLQSVDSNSSLQNINQNSNFNFSNNILNNNINANNNNNNIINNNINNNKINNNIPENPNANDNPNINTNNNNQNEKKDNNEQSQSKNDKDDNYLNIEDGD